DVVITGLFANNLATGTSGAASPKNSTASLDGPYAPGDTSDATAAVVAPMPAAHGDTTVLYDINHGTCTNGGNTDPGDHCNAFFALHNAGAGPDTLSLVLDWVASAGIDNPATGNGVATDMDMLVCSTCDGAHFVSPGGTAG